MSDNAIPLPAPTVPASSWKAVGEGAALVILQSQQTSFKWRGRPIPCIFGESPFAEDIFNDGGGTNQTGTDRFSTLKSYFPAKGAWPQKNDFVEIDGESYQVNTIAGDTDDAHPWLVYKVASNP